MDKDSDNDEKPTKKAMEAKNARFDKINPPSSSSSNSNSDSDEMDLDVDKGGFGGLGDDEKPMEKANKAQKAFRLAEVDSLSASDSDSDLDDEGGLGDDSDDDGDFE